jgi:antitoxin (DNA-binding transcriptional repressor) of toxin-antitoxin stability system
MRGVGRCEAENELGQLLDLVGRGEEIMIARLRKAVARPVATHQAFNRELQR